MECHSSSRVITSYEAHYNSRSESSISYQERSVVSAAHNSNSNSSSYQELFNYFFSVASTASKLDAKKKGIDG